MTLHQHQYYHIFNRSNNHELVFREEENYLYLLRKYRHFLESHCITHAYCLIPTHFHLLVRISSDNIRACQDAFGRWLSSYTKAINKRYNRHGSLFQQHTKASFINDESYLLTAISYIHQNPVRAGYVQYPHEWRFSSYQDLAGFRAGTLPDKELIQSRFPLPGDFRKFSEQVVERPTWL